MSEKKYINIEVSDEDENTKVTFGTNLSIPEMNFWIDHVKNLIVTGQATPVEQE